MLAAIKGAGAFVLGLAALAVALFAISYFIYGAAWASATLVPYLSYATNIAVAVCIFVLAPLALFRRTRDFASTGFLLSSYVFGLCLWMLGFLFTYSKFGAVGVFIGLCLFGIGVVPVGMFAVALEGEWFILGMLLFGAVLTYGTRMLAIWLGQMVERANYAR